MKRKLETVAEVKAADSYFENPNARFSISGTDENSSAFMVGSNRDLMMSHIFSRCSIKDECSMILVCRAWQQWWLENHEHSAGQIRWTNFVVPDFWPPMPC